MIAFQHDNLKGLFFLGFCKELATPTPPASCPAAGDFSDARRVHFIGYPEYRVEALKVAIRTIVLLRVDKALPGPGLF
jgi:hypothetical protein